MQADLFDLIDELLWCLYSEDEIEDWWKTPLEALEGATPRRFLSQPDGPDRLLTYVRSLSE